MADQLPHLDLLPPRLPESQDALADLVYGSQLWNRVHKVLVRRTAAVLWVLTGVGIGSCILLLSVVRSTAVCSNLACSVATFGGHPLSTLLVAAAGTTALLATAALTRGFTRSRGNALWLVLPAAGLTLASVGGILAVVVATLLVLLGAILAIVLVCAFFADHS